MEHLDVHLMAAPVTYMKGKPICFPYQKAEAFFYYIVVEKVFTRDQATTMFWMDMSTESAKQNMRQTLYILKKTFGNNVIKSLPNHQLCISDAFTISCDLDDFYNKRDLGLYRGDIFNGLYIRNAAPFEEWLLRKRESARNYFLTNYLAFMHTVPIAKVDILESCFSRYTCEDPFEEQAYAIMLRCYLKNGLYHKGIQLYKRLCAVLSMELGVEPAHETTLLYCQLLNTRAACGDEAIPNTQEAYLDTKHGDSGWIYGEQFRLLNEQYSLFKRGNGNAVLLCGEHGIGKSYISANFIDANIPKNAFVINVTCYMKNKALALQPWNDLMIQIHKYISENYIAIPGALTEAANRLVPVFGANATVPDAAGDLHYHYQAGKNSILQILLFIARKVELVLLFGNIHAMDALSLDILTNLVHTARQSIFILCTSMDIVDRDTEAFISATQNNGQLERIYFPPMSRDEAEGYIRAEAGSLRMTDGQIEEIYRLSRGNRFFILELIGNIKNGLPLDHFSPRTQVMLSDQLNGLSDDARELLDVISVFEPHVTLDELCFILNLSVAKASRLLEQLKERGIVFEQAIEDRVALAFKHLRMRDFIYSRIAPAGKRRLHERAGLACEHVSPLNAEKDYSFLVRHYSLAGNHAKALQYRIQKVSSDMFPDFLPVVSFAAKTKRHIPAPQAYLNQLYDELAAAKTNQPDALEYDRLEAMLLLTMCRRSFTCGDVNAGIAAFTRLMENGYVWSYPPFLFSAFMQLMEYTAKKGGAGILDRVEAESASAQASAGRFERAALHQFKAVAAILCGDNDRARRLLAAAADEVRAEEEQSI